MLEISDYEAKQDAVYVFQKNHKVVVEGTMRSFVVVSSNFLVLF